MRHTRGHTRNRRSHHALKGVVFAIDPKTGSKHLRHRVDPKTGTYKGKQVLDLVKKVEKKAKKAKAKKAE